MRKIGRTRHHIRYVSCVMAAALGLLQPCTAMAVEEKTEEESGLEASVSGSEDTEDAVTYITAFEPLAEEDAYLPCMYKPALEELLSIFPETLSVWIEGEESAAELDVTWECEENFDDTAFDLYIFYPKWDETLYALADSEEDTIEIPSITVEVPADNGMIHNLEEAKSALQNIVQDKSILALVYLCSEYEVKDGPSQDGETVRTVVSGQSVQITDVCLDEYGAVWYQALFYQNGEEYTGCIEREYLATSDEDFAEWEEIYIDLSSVPMLMTLSVDYSDVEQFPASYQNALYDLKEKHPDWTFVRMDTGLDWNTVIAKEMGDKSLIASSSPDSWKNGIYGQSGQNWSYASDGILKYYMDPRNFLTDPYIFQFEQLTYNSSYHTTDAVQVILKNSFMSSNIPDDNQTYAQAFTKIGESTGVSPFHLASRVLQEQGTKGTSMLISGNYPGYVGYYNYFNVGASGKTNEEVIQNGLKKAVAQGWNTRYKSLYGGAYLIGENYILKGQDTLYLEKFNVSNGQHANYTHQYMQNIQAPNSEASNIRKAYYNADALENSFVFKIPVFKNMPASACSKPNTTDTITLDKTTVSSLEVNKTVTLIPYVNGSKLDSVSNMTFSSDNTSVATVDGKGKVTAISPGSATISCTGSGAGTAKCVVTVVKANPSVSTPTLSPYTYQDDLKLSDIALPDGWTWVKENTEITVGTFSYEALYTPSDTTKYNMITKAVSFTVTKAIPNCQMPDKLEAQTGSTLGDITLPGGFAWESDTETELKEPGEYTFYVSFNPDENNYYTVEHLPLIVQVSGKAVNPSEDDNTSGGSTSGTSTSTGTTSGGSTTSGGTSNSSASTGSISGGSTSGDGTSTGSTTSNGSTSGTSTGITSNGSTSGTSTGTTSNGSTSETSTSTGTTSGGSTTSGGTSNNNTSTGSTSGSSTPTGGTSTGSTSSTSTGTTSTGSTSIESTSGSSTSTGGTSSGSTSSTSTTSNDSISAGSTSSISTTSNNNDTSTGSASNGSASTGGGAPLISMPGSAAAPESTGSNSTSNSSTTTAQAPTTQSTPDNNTTAADKTERGSTLINPQTAVIEESQIQTQTQEEVFFRPSVTIAMEDTTILTPEKLQMAKEQNFNLLLDMGNYATWSIDIDSVNVDALTEVDMGITLSTKNIPAELIAAILNGNKYLEFTLEHDGAFGFGPVLNIALDPINSGRYANLFYYNPETESLEFICDTVIDMNGVASFRMEHASSYVIIVSDTSMSGVSISDDSVNHVTRWIIVGVLICMVLVVIGYGIFFYRRKLQEEEDDEDDEEDEEEEDDEEEEEEEDDGDSEYEDENDSGENNGDGDRESDEEDEENDIEIEDINEKVKERKEPVEKPVRTKLSKPKEKPVKIVPEDRRKPEEIQETDEEDDWIEDEDWMEDEDWQESETDGKEPADGFADDHAEEDWIDDDEWDIENDWMDDAEWEKRNSRKSDK